jgi:hypothetical protein
MIYREFKIEHDGYAYLYSHVEYDGPEDSRIGHAKNVEAAKEDIDEMIDMLESGELKAYKPMEAWSGGIAENH